jgi:hypothetical protein
MGKNLGQFLGSCVFNSSGGHKLLIKPINEEDHFKYFGDQISEEIYQSSGLRRAQGQADYLKQQAVNLL